MNQSQYRFTLDLQSTQSQVCIPVTRGDTARTWLISFRDRSKTYTLTDGCLAKLEILRPTGTHIEEFCPIENNSTVRYSFSQNKNTAAVEGFHECAVVLYDEEGHIIGSPRFSMIVSSRVINSDNIKLSDETKLSVDSMITEEASRRNAEVARVNAESERISAEATRAESEAQRTLNEAARQTADTERSLSEESRTRRFEALQKEIRTAAATLVSPIVTVTPTENGHQVKITDHKSEHMFLVMNGKNGEQGPKGDTGATGKDGTAGYSPIKGVDYFTEADKAEIIQAVLDGIGCPVFGFVNENNNIILSGTLPDGNYSVKYEMEDGSTIDIGILDREPDQMVYTDLVLSACDLNGVIVSYKRDAYNSSTNGPLTGSATGITGIGIMPITSGITHEIYVYGLDFKGGNNERLTAYKRSGYAWVSGQNEVKNLKAGMTVSNMITGVTKLGDYYHKLTTTAWSSANGFALSGTTVDGVEPIVTVDEPIFKVG